ncbi:Zn-ribbon domain-containing OB-fold protein [Piscinibacter sp.]|uniref:Zn-ribbon domain-containing OB-fold protein n=1 Tax=Piscinibacter sp. TaxID=1903157 RepID=UPI002CCA5FE1|nr:OB-fold domain-containing protein [Albitalea sp.]HUG24448.1 OB-fold domain-containing protein [Albitalea sp.]
MSTPRKIPAPRALPESQAFWTAADDGRLLVKTCTDCGKPHFYPRDICPHCLSDRTEWLQAAGTGQVYSFSTMGKGDAAYTLAFVTLDEGVTLMTNLVDCDPKAVAIGQRVRVVFQPSDGGHAVPMFTTV